MDIYHNMPIIYDYWVDREINEVYAVVEWPKRIAKEKYSNLSLLVTEYYDDKKTI